MKAATLDTQILLGAGGLVDPENAYEGSDQVKARLFETYRHEYEKFEQLHGESTEVMFQCFIVIVNSMKANKSHKHKSGVRKKKNKYALWQAWGFVATLSDIDTASSSSDNYNKSSSSEEEVEYKDYKKQ